MVRKIKAEEVVAETARLAREANCFFPEPLRRLIDAAIPKEKEPLAKQALAAILANCRLAKNLSLPLCQDTGLVEVFAEMGTEVRLRLEPYTSLEEAVSAGVRRAYQENYFRASVVDPLSRQNTGDNTPAIVHIRLVAGDRLQLSLLVKGFGSENMGRVASLSPGAGATEIADFVVEAVRAAGSNPCPPVIIGCGLGGTLEKALLLAKEALLKPEELGKPNKDRILAALEREILKRVNRLGIGPAGLGGRTTALAVRVKKFPTHIAGLPVAVNISCWALRVSRVTL